MSDGELIVDNYRLENCVATGNSTQIWEVVEQGSSQRFAMKLLLPESLTDSGQVRTLKREAKAGKLFDHPNLIKVYFATVNKQRGYIIMEYFRAANLKTQIHNDRLALHVRIHKLIESIALALGAMHDRNWLHMDIKPDNILFNKGSELKLVDFSLSAKVAGMFGGKSKEIQGTKSYIAPETLLRKSPSPQTDIYSLGATLYHMLTGEPPVSGDTLLEVL
ncbi:MAG: serine/threonine protein kinase, partial [Planctomycetes bacterium]|nr:serine/threonine protein kinase [Planctomycetota bacterium]